MRNFFGIIFTLVLLVQLLASAADAAKASSEKIRVLVVTGGHGFEKEPFFKLFKDNPDITFQAVEHPNAYTSLKAEAAKHPASHPAVFATSSETGSGIAELRTAILDAAEI